MCLNLIRSLVAFVALTNLSFAMEALGFTPSSEWFSAEKYLKYFPCQGDAYVDWLNQPFGVTQDKYCEELVVSITSHPPRIGTTWLALESIFRQTKKPNRIVLNLAEEDFPDHTLPISLEILKGRGLEVRFSPVNYRVATKLLPTLKDFPNATIVTGDDDRIYAADWLEQLISQHNKNPGMIVCPHARKYVWNTGARKHPRIHYVAYKPIFEKPAYGIFEGFTGVLYPPHSLDLEVFNYEVFKGLTPCADDIWFQVMALKKNTKVIGLSEEVTKRLRWPLEIEGTQAVALYHEHLHANDIMAYRALYYYGMLKLLGIPKLPSMSCRTCHKNIPLINHGESFPTPAEGKKGKCKRCLQ